MTNNTEYGYIYVLTNKYMPNLVKIGKTSKADVNERLKSLYYGNSALPCNFDCEYSYRVPLDKLDTIEKKLHTYFATQRVNESREFFEVSAEEVAKLFWAYDEIFAEATTEIQQKIDFVTSQDTKRVRRENMDFFKLGLCLGDTLVYARDNSKVCTIASSKTVIFHGDELSLSAVSKQLVGRGVQPALYWLTINGQKLIDLYEK